MPPRSIISSAVDTSESQRAGDGGASPSWVYLHRPPSLSHRLPYGHRPAYPGGVGLAGFVWVDDRRDDRASSQLLTAPRSRVDGHPGAEYLRRRRSGFKSTVFQAARGPLTRAEAPSRISIRIDHPTQVGDQLFQRAVRVLENVQDVQDVQDVLTALR